MKKLNQILFESYCLLLEYDLEKTIKQHGEKALSVALSRKDEHMDSYLKDVQGLHDGTRINKSEGTRKHKAMHELMSQFEEADPTPQKKYVQHIARIYGAGGFNRHEDVFSRGKSAIRDFHDLSTRKILPADKRDMGKYKSLADIEDVVDAHKEKLSGNQEDKAYHEKMKQPEHSTTEEHATFTKIIPHTTEAAAHFGKGTKWCTATENAEDSMFDHYNDMGKLHILNPKFPKYAGEKYQFHFGDDEDGRVPSSVKNTQLMDEQDEYAHQKLKDNHPEIHQHLSQYLGTAQIDSRSMHGLHHQEPLVRKAAFMHNEARVNESNGGHLLNDSSDMVRFTAHRMLPADDTRPYNELLKKVNSISDSDNAAHYLNNALSSSPHPGHLLAMIDSRHDDLTYHAAFHKALPKEKLDELSKHDDDGIRYATARNEANSNENLQMLMKDESKNVREAAAETYGRRHKINKPASQIIWHGKDR